MLFPKIDVRNILTSNSTTNHGALITEQVDIALKDVCRSPRALASLERGQGAMFLYKEAVARVAYADAIAFAREDEDKLLIAAGITLLAQLLDGIGIVGPLASLNDALKELQADIKAMEDVLTDQRAKREAALLVMQPRLDLREVIQHNIAQYQLERDANHLHDAKRFADQQIAQRHPETALQIATRGVESATNLFGQNHYLVAVLNTRRALALHLLGRHDEVAKAARGAIALFEEWSASSPEVDNAFTIDCMLMRQALAGELVFGA